jgi:hypothetical protein
LRDIQVFYEGRDIYPDISATAIWHDMYAEGRADTLSLRLNDTRRLWDAWQPRPGDSLAVAGGGASTGLMHIEGVFPESGAVTLRASSVPQSAKARRSKSWADVRLLQLAEETAALHGLGFAHYGVADRLYPFVEQLDMTDFEFLQGRAVLEGAAFLVFDGTLVLYDERYLEAGAPAGAVAVGRDMDFAYRDGAARLYGACEVTNGAVSGSFVAPGGGARGTLRRVLPLAISDIGEADRFARGLLRAANKNAAGGSVVLLRLAAEFAAGSVAALSTVGAAAFDGRAFVSHLRFDYVGERSKLFFRRPLEGY